MHTDRWHKVITADENWSNHEYASLMFCCHCVSGRRKGDLRIGIELVDVVASREAQ